MSGSDLSTRLLKSSLFGSRLQFVMLQPWRLFGPREDLLHFAVLEGFYDQDRTGRNFAGTSDFPF